MKWFTVTTTISFSGGFTMDYLKRYRKMIALRGLTDHTVRSYSTYISAYLDYMATVVHKYPSQATWNDMRRFIDWLQQTRSLSDRTINGVISQLRFFTLYVLHKPWDPYQLPMRRFDSYLPYVPAKSEVQTFISALPDLKQKAMVSLLYSAGLRIGEVCRLKYKDIERKNMRIHVSHGKNRSDRYAILSENTLAILTEYWRTFGKPTDWLFPKQHDLSRPIDTFYLMRHMRTHEERLGWEHRITCHSFRHAFGTHLYENGADLLTIKHLMGHKSLDSTMIYVHLASFSSRAVKSPFDLMGGVPHE